MSICEVLPSAPPAYDSDPIPHRSYDEEYVVPVTPKMFNQYSGFPDEHLFDPEKKQCSILRMKNDVLHCTDLEIVLIDGKEVTRIQPAAQRWNGVREWRVNGLLSREEVDENGILLPALILPNGGIERRINGILTSEYKGKIFPAKERGNCFEYYRGGKLHSFEIDGVIQPSRIGLTSTDILTRSYHKDGQRHSYRINGVWVSATNCLNWDKFGNHFGDYFYLDGQLHSYRDKTGIMMPAQYNPVLKRNEWYVLGKLASWQTLDGEWMPAWVADDGSAEWIVNDIEWATTHPYKIDAAGVKYYDRRADLKPHNMPFGHVGDIISILNHHYNECAHKYAFLRLIDFEELHPNGKKVWNLRKSVLMRSADDSYDTLLPDGTRQWYSGNNILYREIFATGERKYYNFATGKLTKHVLADKSCVIYYLEDADRNPICVYSYPDELYLSRDAEDRAIDWTGYIGDTNDKIKFAHNINPDRFIYWNNGTRVNTVMQRLFTNGTFMHQQLRSILQEIDRKVSH